jgi:3-mercaptopyruvate sulfurtransferase SseA
MLTAMTASRGERVVYVDTNNAFSGERLAWLMQRIGLKQSVSVKSIGCMDALFFAYYADYLM